MNSTGVTILIRSTQTEYGMHDVCAVDLITQLVDAGYSVLDNDMPAVIVGPLFAPADEWTCAHSACKVGA